MRRLQNRIAESSTILPVAAVYAIGIWLLSGLTTHHWWPQLACLAASCYLFIEISNSNALLRVRSRMVTTTFLFLTCMYPEAFGSLTSAFTQLGFIVTTLLLFNTYQDNLSMGKVFYAFLCISLCSLAFVHVLFLVPVLWLMMYTQLQSFSLRTFFASIIGLITPYWFLSLWFIYVQDFSLLGQHFAALGVFEPIDYMEASLEQVLVSSFLLILSIASIIHFWHNSYEDKMHIRMLYGFFTLMTLLLMLFIALQPQHFDILIGLVFVCASPLIAHLLTLTSTRFTNIAFFVILATCLIITTINLWKLL